MLELIPIPIHYDDSGLSLEDFCAKAQQDLTTANLQFPCYHIKQTSFEAKLKLENNPIQISYLKQTYEHVPQTTDGQGVLALHEADYPTIS